MFVVKTLKLSNWTTNSGSSYCSAWPYRFYFALESHFICHWAPLRRAWIHLSSSHFASSIYYIHWSDLFIIYIDQMHSEPSPLWTKWSQLSQPLIRRDGQDSYSSLWPFNGPSLVVPHVSCPEEPRIAHSTPGAASPAESRGNTRHKRLHTY